MRLFTAVTLGDTLTARAEQGIERLRAHAPEAKWVKPEGVHLTLLFLGDVDPSCLSLFHEALDPVGPRHAPFVLSVGGGGTFGAPHHPSVLWADVRGDIVALKALQADVASALAPLGFASEHPEYTAHLTLARSKKPHGDAALAACARLLDQESWGEGRVDRLSVFESAGGHYASRWELPLGRGA
ncbi:RNA 2',3'-cyclic phosphodiesterase [Corallococcus sp. bb12-1]|uniref:RNA 2',3'-cyclic phosphodiesterase n=1 Tax=Corallococcus sp. bb12-1 TaxID=2996784 RepID=UPI002270A642|nr:RNA 2',3'-cyclic phosphodiesterase [Corallococcus sp. bb12-1]MCY1040075.1 RNA 2',3'-cyclic phosphodiesterase [Corallococcus sp. bb12-1]